MRVPAETFLPTQYVVAAALYALLAGVVAVIYPAKHVKDPRWNALIVGLTLPLIISGAVSAADRTINSEQGLRTRGPVVVSGPPNPVPGNLVDLLAIY